MGVDEESPVEETKPEEMTTAVSVDDLETGDTSQSDCGTVCRIVCSVNSLKSFISTVTIMVMGFILVLPTVFYPAYHIYSKGCSSSIFICFVLGTLQCALLVFLEIIGLGVLLIVLASIGYSFFMIYINMLDYYNSRGGSVV